jgi:hypothetical protein
MTKEEEIKWLENLKKDIGQPQHQELWHYAEAIDKIMESLSAEVVSEDTQTKTELVHIEARLENVEKRLQGLILYGGVIR